LSNRPLRDEKSGSFSYDLSSLAINQVILDTASSLVSGSLQNSRRRFPFKTWKEKQHQSTWGTPKIRKYVNLNIRTCP
jgi:hypothetical protein